MDSGFAGCDTRRPMQIEAPPLPSLAVAESFKLPSGANFHGTSGIAFNSKGNILVIHRGPMPLMEFDPDGKFIRGFGDGLFERSHGLRIDAQDNIWATDVVANLVYKFNPSAPTRNGAGLQRSHRRVASVRPSAAIPRTERSRGWPDRRDLRAAGA